MPKDNPADQEVDTLVERLRMEAQLHAQEARTANATIAEIYQTISNYRGEPGNWNGAIPVSNFVVEVLQLLRDARNALSGNEKTEQLRRAIEIQSFLDKFGA
jgi:hypothetical protein